jgi:hypothetical protein
MSAKHTKKTKQEIEREFKRVEIESSREKLGSDSVDGK